MKTSTLIFAFILSVAVSAQSTPRQIVLIRHAEKLDDSHRDLSPQGCQRAYQLTNFFSAYESDVVAIYAQQAKKAWSSIRPLETIAPTAKAVGLKINNNFLRDDVTSVASEILNSKAYDNKTIFIAWEHSAIPNLARALGLQLPTNLQEWPSPIFDQAWILNYDHGKPKLTIVAEMALPTDILPTQSGVNNWGSETAPKNNGITLPQDLINECSQGNSGLDQIVKVFSIVPVPNL